MGEIGKVTVGNVKHGIEGGIYIGRKNRGYNLQQSPLANPNPIDVKTASPQQIATNLAQYKRLIWQSIQAQAGAPYIKLCKLRDRLLRGEDLLLLCWCKESGSEPCHGEIVKAALEWMCLQSFFEAALYLEELEYK